jgi:hypothetical protein
MSQVLPCLRFEFVQGVWVSHLDSPFGAIEVVVDGAPGEPDAAQMVALEAFLPYAASRVIEIRRQLRLAFLYSPIRIAVNQKNLVGVQYRNRLTGAHVMLMSKE